MAMTIRVVPQELGVPPVLAVGMESGTLFVWDARRCSLPLCQAKLQNEPMTSLFFSPPSVASRRYLFKQREMDSKSVTEEQEDLTTCSSSPSALPANAVLGMTGGASNTLTQFAVDVKQGHITTVASVTLPNNGVSELSVREDYRVFASAGWDHRVRLYSWAALTPLAVLPLHTDTVHSVAFAPQGLQSAVYSNCKLPDSSDSDSDSSDQEKGFGLVASAGNDKRIAIYNLFPSQ